MHLLDRKIVKGIKVIDDFLANHYYMQIRSTITVYNEYRFFFDRVVAIKVVSLFCLQFYISPDT